MQHILKLIHLCTHEAALKRVACVLCSDLLRKKEKVLFTLLITLPLKYKTPDGDALRYKICYSPHESILQIQTITL